MLSDKKCSPIISTYIKTAESYKIRNVTKAYFFLVKFSSKMQLNFVFNIITFVLNFHFR